MRSKEENKELVKNYRVRNYSKIRRKWLYPYTLSIRDSFIFIYTRCEKILMKLIPLLSKKKEQAQKTKLYSILASLYEYCLPLWLFFGWL